MCRWEAYSHRLDFFSENWILLIGQGIVEGLPGGPITYFFFKKKSLVDLNSF